MSAADRGPTKILQATAAVAPPKVHPALRSKSDRLDVVVLLHEDFQHPSLPRLGPDEKREDASWLAKSAIIQQHIQTAAAARNSSQDRLTKMLLGGGATVTEQFWLVNAFIANIDASQLPALEADAQVKQVSPVVGGSVLANIVSGRVAMNSDPYFNQGLTSGWIALLDSGIRYSHALLTGRTSWVRDCVNGLTDNCSVAGAGLTLDASDVLDHGTGVASIMAGGSAVFGDPMRGVTAIPFDSFRVVVPAGGIDSGAVARGFSAAVAGGDNVVNCSIDCGTTLCSDAANAAFDAGLVVVAGAGNSGSNHIADPASGKKVLAIGALDPTAWTRVSYSSTGPSTFGPTKPDLMAVGGSTSDNLTAASSAYDLATMSGAGTSLASPFVAGGAALMRRSLAFNAGQTYAMLMASGMNFSPSPIPSADNTQGAGRLALPSNVNRPGIPGGSHWLRGWSHGTKEQTPGRGAGASGAVGVRAVGGARVAVGGDHGDRTEVGLHARNLATVGAARGA
jgi:hypothetical protein